MTVSSARGSTRPSISDDAQIARLILINGPPASGKSTLARRYVDEHERVAVVDVDSVRTTLPDWEDDESTRLLARDRAGTAVVEHLDSGRDVVMPQYFGRLGYIALLDDIARQHHATFVEVILATDADLAVERFRARRRAMAARGERHPERDIADVAVEAFIEDAAQRLTRLPTVRPGTHVIPIEAGSSEDEVYRRLCSVLDETTRG
jgi:predicted kinase